MDAGICVLWCIAVAVILSSGPAAFAIVAIVCAVMYIIGFVLRTWVYGVTFTDDAVIIQGIVRHRVSRADVSDVLTQEWWGTTHVILTGPRGRVRLPAPVSGPLHLDTGFAAKVHSIEEWTSAPRPSS